MNVRVLYIAGSGRSGTTLLDRLLGEDGSFRTGGEIAGVWILGVIGDRLCSCGRRFSECKEWSRVVAGSGAGLADEMAEAVAGYHNANFPAKMSWRLLSAKTRKALASEAPAGYFEALAALYGQMVGDARTVVVDSSKHPMYMYFLSLIPSIDLRVVHLVRDPRAVAYSWAKPVQPDPDGRTTMAQVSPAKAAVAWTLINAASDWVIRRLGRPAMRLRYEDLVRSPDKMLEVVKEFALGADAVGRVPVESLDAGSHMISGNPLRFAAGAITVREDVEWRSAMKRLDRAVVLAIGLPLALRYRYLGAGWRR